MAPRISYVIPTLNEEEMLAATLRSIEAQPEPKEVIVVDGGSADNSLGIARDFGCKLIKSPLGRGEQLNRGADQATGDIVFFLHADTRIPKGASPEIQSLLDTPSVIAASFRLRFEPSSWALRFYSLCSAINSSLFTYGDQGLFLYRSTFIALGGFKSYPILEDVDLQVRLRLKGRFVKSKLAVTTSARRFKKHGVVKQQLLNLCILAAYHGGANPNSLARFYSNLR